LKDTFFNLEDLLEKIRAKGDDEKLNMDKVNARIQEYRKQIEYIIKEKKTKEAKELIREISQMDFGIRNVVTGNAGDVELLHYINSEFHSFVWKDASKARNLVNQGMNMAAEGKKSAIRPILVQLVSLMPNEMAERIGGRVR